MHQKILSAGLAVGLTVLSSLPGLAKTSISVEPVAVVTGTVRAEFMIGYETWSGENTYQIGHPVHWGDGSVVEGHFPFSELAFPLDIGMLTAQTSLLFHDTWKIMVSVKKDVRDPADKMIDKDWLTASDPYQLDVYSTSDITDFEGFEFDTSFQYQFFNDKVLSLNAGAGYLYQSWKYTTALIEQYSPSGLEGFDFIGDDSTAIIYKLDYYIPYFRVGGAVQAGSKLRLFSSFSYSPFAYAENIDQHLLRYKENKGDLDGTAVMFELGGQVDLSENWYLTVSYDYKKMEVDGTMTAEFDFDVYESLYGVVPNHSVWEEIVTEQHILTFNLSYFF